MQTDALPTDSRHKEKDAWLCDTSVSETTLFKAPKVNPGNCNRYMLWIDGVGAWQLCVGESFIVGAPSFDGPSADIALLANVSRHHATVARDGEVWRLSAEQATSVSGKRIDTSTILRSGDQICLAERVRLGFRIPSVLSTSAVIDFESDHRPSHSVDGIILLSDHCLLGPRRDHHIFCPGWTDVVVLYAQDGELRCRSKAALTVDGAAVMESAGLSHGTVVTSAEEVRFRVEKMD
ncbi:MAG: FHA domain-containing protein [Planctomycetaceae bacterium]|nr:FHA domain-containing protein [Planctomycetaceae bacterium]